MERGSGINFEYWSKVATIEIWEAAAMIWGVDPRAIASGDIADKSGDVPDLAEGERMLASAVRAGGLAASDDQTGSAPGKRTHVLTTSLIKWFRNNGQAHLAHGLESSGAQGISPSLVEATRRLARLRSLGGDCTFDQMEGKWKITRLKQLKAEEDAEGCHRTSEKTLRRDLVSAADAEKRNSANRFA